MNFSKRTDWATSSNKISKLLSDKRKNKEKILDLTESNPTRCGFNSENILYDPDPHGLWEAREAVCRYYADKKTKVTPDQIFLTASTSEAYAFLFRLLANPGDSILAPEPSYPLFDYLAGLNDVSLRKYALRYEEEWRINLDSIAAAGLKPALTKAIIVVNPNNPTGNFVKRHERDELNRMAKTRETAIISDEVFLDFAFDNFVGVSQTFAGNRDALTFTLGGISKILGLPQMKLSWIVVSGPEDLKRQAIEKLELIADTYLSVSTPSQKALPEWLGNREQITGEILKRVRGNRNTLREHLRDKKSMRLLEAEGGWYAVLEVDSPKNDEELALDLLKNKNVFVHPGYFFDFPKGNFLVLSLLPEPKIFGKGIKHLR